MGNLSIETTMTKYFIGQRVVCIEDFVVKRKYKEQYPEKGKTYTIRKIIQYRGQVGILLEEIVNPTYQYGDGHNEAAYEITNFRPEEYQPATSEILQRFRITEERIDGETSSIIKIKTNNKK